MEMIPVQEVIVQDPVYLPKPPKIKPRKTFVVIDAGHGGQDLGTVAPSKPTLNEKNLNLATAKMLQVFLQQMGFKTLLTRGNDTFVTLDNRAEIANNLAADLFISVHYNSAPSVKAEGIEIFYYESDQDKNRSDTSKRLAENILKKMINNSKAKSRGVKHGNLAVIKKTKMPAVLIEGGFLTNENELKKLRDPSYIKDLAWSIAQGIQEFTQTK
jgi:N-acetylmuramoyl-L-alanine amidase